MHIHFAAPSAMGNSLAGAALAAETALATRRARELRDAGRKLTAASFDAGFQFADQLQTDPQSAAQSLTILASDAGSEPSAQASAESFAQRFTGDLQRERPPTRVPEIQPAPPSAPVSYWA